MSESETRDTRKCPVCGKGDLVDVIFREGGLGEEDAAIQTADTHQVEIYSCGHEVPGPRLDRTASASDELDAEHRTSKETVEPPEDR